MQALASSTVPIGLDAQVGFQPPLAVAEPGRAVVAGAGVDLVELDHRRPPLAGDSAAAVEIDGEQDQHQRDELQEDARLHQLVRRVARAAAHHVDEAAHQHDHDRDHDDDGEDVEDCRHGTFPYRSPCQACEARIR